MNIFGISKFVGILLSLAILYKPITWFSDYVKMNQYSLELSLLFILACLLFLFRYNEGKKKLTFFGSDTGTVWDDGLCLVPSLPILRGLHFPLFWDLRKIEGEYYPSENQNVNVKHFQDQNRAQMHLHADTSTTFVIFREILNALNPFEKKEDDLHFQKLGLILALFAIVAGFFCNYVYPKREKGSEWSSVQFSKAKLPDSGFEFAPVMFHTKGTSQQPVYSPIPEQCVLIAPNKTVVIKMRYHVKLSNYEDTEGVQLLDTSTGRWGVSTWTQVNNSTLGMKEPFINEVIVGVKGVPSLSKESFICL